MNDIGEALRNALNNYNPNKTKEKQMHTQTNDLTNTISNWAADRSADTGAYKAQQKKEQTLFKPTNNISRVLFNLVHDNPGIDYKSVCDKAEQHGYKRASAGSILTQFVRVGMVHKEEDGGLYTTQPEYTPVKLGVLRAAQRKVVREALAKTPRPAVSLKPPKIEEAKRAVRKYVKSGKYVKKDKQGIAALGVQPAAPAAIPAAFDADQLLSTLSFNQAIALYKKLKQMLGEV